MKFVNGASKKNSDKKLKDATHAQCCNMKNDTFHQYATKKYILHPFPSLRSRPLKSS